MPLTRELDKQIAVVTGAGRGLGRAFARTLASAGATVALVARSAGELADAAAEIARDGGNARVYPADVAQPGALDRVVRDLGPIDLLVNNAGVLGPIGPFWESDADAYRRALEINLHGPLLCMHAVLPAMQARGRGRIINVASGAAGLSIPYFSSYCAAKTALVRATECVAIEARQHGVFLFVISPGAVRTSMSEHSLMSEEGRTWLPWYGDLFEQGLNLTPEHSATLVRRLASGAFDSLAGLFLTPLDDLDAIARERTDVRARRLYSLRIRRLGPEQSHPIFDAAERAKEQ